jgi:hypothetical protein
LDDLSSEEELSEGIGVISKLGQCYRHMYVELKAHLKDNHGVSYPKHEEILNRINTYLVDARIKIRESKKNFQKEKVDDKKFQSHVEFDMLRRKLRQVNNLVDIYIGRSDGEIDRYVSRMENFVDEFHSLVAKIQYTCPDLPSEFEVEFS